MPIFKQVFVHRQAQKRMDTDRRPNLCTPFPTKSLLLMQSELLNAPIRAVPDQQADSSTQPGKWGVFARCVLFSAIFPDFRLDQ
jgi:hypothetical protein